MRYACKWSAIWFTSERIALARTGYHPYRISCVATPRPIRPIGSRLGDGGLVSATSISEWYACKFRTRSLPYRMILGESRRPRIKETRIQARLSDQPICPRCVRTYCVDPSVGFRTHHSLMLRGHVAGKG